MNFGKIRFNTLFIEFLINIQKTKGVANHVGNSRVYCLITFSYHAYVNNSLKSAALNVDVMLKLFQFQCQADINSI